MTAFGNTNEVFDLVKTGAIVNMNLCRIYRLKSKLFQPKILFCWPEEHCCLGGICGPEIDFGQFGYVFFAVP